MGDEIRDADILVRYKTSLEYDWIVASVKFSKPKTLAERNIS